MLHVPITEMAMTPDRTVVWETTFRPSGGELLVDPTLDAQQESAVFDVLQSAESGVFGKVIGKGYEGAVCKYDDLALKLVTRRMQHSGTFLESLQAGVTVSKLISDADIKVGAQGIGVQAVRPLAAIDGLHGNADRGALVMPYVAGKSLNGSNPEQETLISGATQQIREVINGAGLRSHVFLDPAGRHYLYQDATEAADRAVITKIDTGANEGFGRLITQ